MNKTTRSITDKEYFDIINNIKEGFMHDGKKCRGNLKVAVALQLEYNLGLRISDVLSLKLSDIQWKDNQYRLDIVEQKTGKKRRFTVSAGIYEYIKDYCSKNKISADELIIDITERQVQRILKKVCDYLKLSDVSTHSFRKKSATDLYENNNHDIALVREFLQHSSIAITQRYIACSRSKLNQALEQHQMLY